MAGPTVTETVQILGFSRGTISKIMTAYEKKVKLALQSIDEAAITVCLKETEKH